MLTAATFALLALVCTVLAFKRHPIWGVYFYLATTFVFPQGRWWGVFFPGFRWALMSAAVVALAILFHQGKLKPKPIWLANAPAVILVLYAAWMWLQTPLALDLSAHLNGASVFTKYLLAFWFIYRCVDSKDRVRDLLFAHVLGCTFLGIIAHLIGREGDRLDGVGGPGIDDANSLGMYLVTGVIAGIGLVITQTGWRRYATLACLVFVGNGVVLANSRGSFLGAVAGALVLYLFKAKQHRWVFYGFVLVGCLGAIKLVDEAFVERMFTISDATRQDDDADASARSRIVVMEAQLRMFMDHPIGVGHRGTAVLSTSYLDPKWLTLDKTGNPDSAARSSHNSFLSALVEQGLLGGILYLTMVMWILGAALRARRLQRWRVDPSFTTLGATVAGMLVVVLVAGITTDYLLAEVQFWMLAVLVSLFQIAEQEASEQLPLAPAAAVPRTQLA